MNVDEARRVLSLSGRPSLGEAKAAYRRLVKLWHPDLAHGDESDRARREANMKTINAAYRLITGSLLPRGRSSAPSDFSPRPRRPPSRSAIKRWVWFRDLGWPDWDIRDGIHEAAFLVMGFVLFGFVFLGMYDPEMDGVDGLFRRLWPLLAIGATCILAWILEQRGR